MIIERGLERVGKEVVIKSDGKGSHRGELATSSKHPPGVPVDSGAPQRAGNGG